MTNDILKVLITGASGFVGKNLVSQLKRDRFQISTVGRSDCNYSWANLRGSDLDGKSIIHLAGKAHDLKNVSNPADYFTVNTELSKNLFELFLQSSARDFIYFSSVKAVVDSSEFDLIESTPANPITPYGISKLRAEEYLVSARLPKSKRLFIIRPCMIHGPGNKGNLNLLYKLVKSGLPYPLGAFTNRRSFLSIDNLVFAIREILKNNEIPGGIYNLADDEPLSTKEVVSIMAKSMDRSARIWNVNKPVVLSLAKLGDILRLPFNTERINKLTENYVVSNSKIKGALQIDKFPVSSVNGLIKTVKSFNI